MKKRSIALTLVLAVTALTGVTGAALTPPAAGTSVLAQPCCKGGS